MRSRLGLLAASALALSACATARTPSPEQVDVSPPATDGRAPSAERRAPPSPDVRFVTGMIAHHAQALEMTRLVPSRAAREEVRLIAGRIEASQQDEIDLMRAWLRRRGHDSATTAHAHHPGHASVGSGHDSMPGMLSAEEMARLAAATGPAFDRLFLELMIRHHEGALAMVAELLAAPRGADDPETFRLASDVDSDQRAEIRRMREVLQRTQK